MPRKADEPIVVLTPEEKRRLEWEEFQRQDTAYQEAQFAAGNVPCPTCGVLKGYNPVTGIQVRSFHGRREVAGHRESCPKNTIEKK